MTQAYTQILADFLGSAHFDALPVHVVEKAKTFLLDYIGYAASATHSACARILRQVTDDFGGVQEATVIGVHEALRRRGRP
jgi:2-methylcitrate dehydratase PrpD